MLALLPRDATYVLVDLRYQHFLDIWVEETVLQFTVLLFNLNIAPWVFVKTMKPVARALSHLDIEIMMNLIN